MNKTDMDEIVKQNRRECPHCKFLYETFLEYPDPYNGEREYYLMTEVFVYLHGGVVCDYFLKERKRIREIQDRDFKEKEVRGEKK